MRAGSRKGGEAWHEAAFHVEHRRTTSRIAVEWDGTGGRQSGVYIPRRDSNSVATVLAGGRLFPGEHHRASFDVRETAQDLHVAFASTDGTAHVSIDVRVAQRLQGSALFTDLREASDFFRRGSAGFSATRDSGRFDGLELRADRWVVESAEVHAVCSSFFGDVTLFPPGSATLDCALLMRDIPVTWIAMQPAFPASERQRSREVALRVSPGQFGDYLAPDGPYWSRDRTPSEWRRSELASASAVSLVRSPARHRSRSFRCAGSGRSVSEVVQEARMRSAS
jgi:hypothetical protein